MVPWKVVAYVAIAIGIIYVILLAVAGFGSAEASAGHFVSDVSKGTLLEQPAASVETAGNSLTKTADDTIGEFTALIIVGALIVAVALDS